MKKLLYILLIIPFTFFGQNTAYIQQDSPLEFSQGWNMFGFSCYEPMNLIEAFSPITDKVIVVKDNDGAVYMPEFSFNGIGSLRRNLGYQIKLTEIITDFQFCPFIVPLVEGCMDETAFNYNSDANMDDGSCYPYVYGCLDTNAFNFNDYDRDGNSNEITGINGIDINADDESCFDIIYGCLDTEGFNYNDYDGDGVANELTGINGVDVNTDDGSCIPFIYGCTDETAYNYNPDANTNDLNELYCIPIIIGCNIPNAYNYNDYDGDGEPNEFTGNPSIDVNTYLPNSCIDKVFGCTDTMALNYSDEANTNDDSCVPFIYGCTGALSFNYDSLANTDDGTCIPFIYGCTDETALNYNDSANTNDGSCIAIIEGCTDETAFNFDENANVEDGSCIPFIYGCTDETAYNYNPDANTSDLNELYCIPVIIGCNIPNAYNYNDFDGDGEPNEFIGNPSIDVNTYLPNSCIDKVFGCTDVMALNYSDEANTDDGSCVPFIYGCTSTLSFNYDSLANTDDGTCIPFIYGCLDTEAFNFNPEANTSYTGDELFGYCYPFIYGCLDPNAFNFNDYDGDGVGNEITGIPGVDINTEDGSCIAIVEGCTDEEAINYDSSANTDDESCVQLIYGCLDSLAFNFNSEANTNDGSCIPFIYGCLDSNAINYIHNANSDNGSCSYSFDICEFQYDENFGYNEYWGNFTFLFLESAVDFLNLNSSNPYIVCFINSSQRGYASFSDLQNGMQSITVWGNQIDNDSEINFKLYDGIVSYDIIFNQEIIYNQNGIGVGGVNEIFPGQGQFVQLSSLSNACYLEEPISGCMDSLACNYIPEANFNDGSCFYPSLGFDCDSNELDLFVGQSAFGGIVFHINEDGESGLVISTEDLPSNYQWGCRGVNVYTGKDIGFGYQNTINILNQNCLLGDSENLYEGISAAEASVEYENEGYNDWFLPSSQELVKVYNTVGGGIYLGNMGGVSTESGYWSSSVLASHSHNHAKLVYFSGDLSSPISDRVRDDSQNVRPIRAFGNWTMGCMDSLACNYNPEANMADASCEYRELGYDCDGNLAEYVLGMQAEGGVVFYVDETGERGLIAAMEDLPGTYEWGCYGIDINGDNYNVSPEIHSIGSGYQNTLAILAGCSDTNTAAYNTLNSNIEGYTDWYLPSRYELQEMFYTDGYIHNLGIFNNQVNDNPEGNIGGFSIDSYWSSTETNQNVARQYYWDGYNNSSTLTKNSYNRVRPIRAIGYTLGCMDSLACNYNPEANMADGSCTYAELGYDCDGNITEYVVGMEAEGGIVFYVDETGERGLVASTEDLGLFECGCFNVDIDGADGQAIGTGYQNSMDIINQGCTTENGGITAAQAALDAEINGYSDWYLPSLEELYEIYYSIGQGASNIGNFSTSRYWSSSEGGEHAWGIYFRANNPGQDSYYAESFSDMVRPIRAFGNWTMGCMDSLACNYNPEANMAGCTYRQLGYDCDGNITEYVVGMEAEGGIVFYVDETGERGLVAATEDLEEIYEWGCYGVEVDGADGILIGTGYQNTLDIVAGCSETPIAASAALSYESAGYSDWYLPSRGEQLEIFTTIGQFSPEGNIGGFKSGCYWTSSEIDITYASYLYFDPCPEYPYKNHSHWVRPIRAFGNWIMGCTDSIACNFNPEANTTDGSCEYSDEGYDCEGNINVQVGDEAFGGIVFYVDETGQHGLVAAMQDLSDEANGVDGFGNTGYEFGCYGENVDGADNSSMGSGYQNTLDIVQDCATVYGGVTAAQAALNSVINGFNDWYLPSQDELYQMYLLKDIIGGFGDTYYRSSTESNLLGDMIRSYTVYFGNGSIDPYRNKNYYHKVRPIRSF